MCPGPVWLRSQSWVRLLGRVVVPGLVPSSSTSFWGSVVLLVPRRWQQTPALKPHTRDENGNVGGFHPSGSCVSRPHCRGYTAPGTGKGTTDSPSCHRAGTTLRVASHRAVPSSTCPTAKSCGHWELCSVHFKSCILVAWPRPFSLSFSLTIPF